MIYLVTREPKPPEASSEPAPPGSRLEHPSGIAVASSSDPLSTSHNNKVLKFSYKYSPAAHALLSQVGSAPKLDFCEYIEDLRMWATIMDYIPNADIETSAQLSEAQKNKLKQAVDTLHKQSFVLGDLRVANLLASKESDDVWIIDLEWSGKNGEVRYPEDINKDLDWAKGVGPGEVIELAHDLYRLERILGGYPDEREQ